MPGPIDLSPTGLLAVAGFASWWMLLWGAAAVIPIVLHFWYRRRQVRIAWAAIHLLQQVVEKEAKRVRVEQLLLLILRTLILLLLAASLARPFWESAAADQLSEAQPVATTWILAIDVSYSMGYRSADDSRLQLAQQRALEIVESAIEGDAFALIAMGRPPRAVISRPTFDRDLAAMQIRKLTLSDAGCNPPASLQVARELARSASQSEALPAQVKIILLSDFGADHWKPLLNGPAAQKLQRLSQEYLVAAESFADDRVANIAITALHAETLRSIAGTPLEVDVEVENFGSSTVVQLPVQISLDGQTVASEYVDLEPREARIVRLALTPKNPGMAVMSASLPSDRLDVDNRRSQILVVRERDDILLVSDRPRDSRVIELSLQPTRQRNDRQRITRVSSWELASQELERYSVIILHEPTRIDAPNFNLLSRYVSGGGALINLVGAAATGWEQVPNYSQLLGMQIVEPSEFGDWTIDPRGYASPMVEPFEGFPDAGLLTTPIFRYWKVAELDESAIIDLALSSGDPLIVRYARGEGQVISFLSAPQSGAGGDSAWNAIATWPSFVPLMQRIVQVAVDSGAEGYTLLAGEPLLGEALAANDSAIGVLKPDGSESQIVPEPINAAGVRPWIFTATHRSGIYTIRQAGGETQPYAINIPTTESSLQSIDPTELPIVQKEVSQDLAIPATNARPPITPLLSQLLLLLIGVLLIVESTIALFLGRRSA